VLQFSSANAEILIGTTFVEKALKLKLAAEAPHQSLPLRNNHVPLIGEVHDTRCARLLGYSFAL
jgi:hypothetical protein